MSRVTHVDESCHTCELSHVTHMNESCHTYESYVMVPTSAVAEEVSTIDSSRGCVRASAVLAVYECVVSHI